MFIDSLLYLLRVSLNLHHSVTVCSHHSIALSFKKLEIEQLSCLLFVFGVNLFLKDFKYYPPDRAAL